MNLTAEKSLQICTVIKMPLYRVSPVEPDSLRNIENIFICPKKNAENNSKHHKSINIWFDGKVKPIFIEFLFKSKIDP